MPLPVGGNVPWPPEEHTHLYVRYREHAAWYAGDPNMLADVYAYGYGQQHRTGEPVGSGSGGSMILPSHSALWRLNFDRFWARVTTAPWRRLMLHLPIAADIATTSADLLFSDPVSILIPEAHGLKADSGAISSQDRLTELIEVAGVPATLTESAETSAALGGVFLRVTWDKDVEPEHPLLTSVDADSAVPEFRWGKLTAVTFWRVVNVADDETQVWRHLERHEPGYVLHGLYRGTAQQLGTSEPLDRMGPDWTIADQLTDEGVVPTGIKRLTAVYVPNMRPNRLWRGSLMGRSDYDGVEPIMDSLDETWTSWMRDLRLGRARLIIPEEYMDAQGPGKSGIFDIDQEVFESLPMAVQRDDNMINPSQFQIRSQEHLALATALMDRIVAAAGYSATTFGLEEVQRGVTATEIISRERRSIITRDKKISYWRVPLREILSVFMEIDAAQFQRHEVFDAKIEWPDAVQEDPGKMSATVVTLRQALAASTDTLVRMVHPSWTDEQVAAEVDRIHTEQVPVKVGGPVAAGQPGQSDPKGVPFGLSRGAGSKQDSSGLAPDLRRVGTDSLPPGSSQGGGE